MKSRRKGFAIVLVAALAGLVFLLGATLVVVTRLQAASASYDQRVRLAREHARAAMDIAVAELQEALGRDTSVSFAADTLREETANDFKTAASPTLDQPFWTGASNGGDPVWLVTRELDGDLDEPKAGPTGDDVLLYGNAPGVLGHLKVTVPKEPIKVTGVDGYDADEAKTIGHYGYWVGDLGVKASYALYDKSEKVFHDDYTDNQRARLSQMRIAKPMLGIGGLNTNSTTGSTLDVSNPLRIDAFLNDFQFRDRYGSSSETERFLIGLSESDFEDHFHDFTPLSKGLLVNSETGGFRGDLSTLQTISNDGYDDDILPYVKLAKAVDPTSGSYGNEVYSMRAADENGPSIHPVLTQFYLGYSVYLVPTGDFVTSDLVLDFSGGFELWNPFSTSLKAENLRLEVKGLPRVFVDLNTDTTIDLAALDEQPVFSIPATVAGSGFWEPGQIATFTGPRSSNAVSSPFVLSEGIGWLSSSSNRVVVDNLEHVVSGVHSSIICSFVDGLGADASANITVELYLDLPESVDQDEGGADVLLAEYALPAGSEFTCVDVVDTTPLGSANTSFGFSWEILDPSGGHLSNYNPFDGSLESSSLDSLQLDSGSGVNVEHGLELASNDLILAPNPTESDETRSAKYDLSALQLPKQELVSVSHLASAYGNSFTAGDIGEPSGALNSLYDSHFFSTVGLPGGDWDESKGLANSGYLAKPGVAKAELQSTDSAAGLFAHGMFNVHSTSIDAWASLLKGRPVVESDNWYDDFEALEGDDGNDELDESVYLFFNYPYSAEDRFLVSPDVSGEAGPKRASFNQSMIGFTESEVELLALHIVSNIRQRLQGVGDYNDALNKGPFSSLQEFVDSEVLKNAISDAHDAIKVGGDSVFNPSWVFTGSNREFRQSTILNLISPYLSVRSDTFLVRAYGDAVDPSDETRIWARAYCEAIVQRTHEVVDVAFNERKFEIVAFRWISPSEI